VKQKLSSVLFLRAFLFFFHSCVTIIISFLPLYFKSKGLTGSQIGWLLAIGPFAAILSQPFWGYMSDKYKTVKRMMLICIIGLILSSSLLFQMESFMLYMLLGAIFFAFMSPVGALGDSLAQKTSRKAGVSFGSIRMWGSLGFATTALISGQVLSFFGIESIYYIFLVYVSIALIICLNISDVNETKSPVSLADTKILFKNSKLMSFLFIVTFITITHRANDSFIGLYITELGGTESLIGWSWFVAVASEAVVFATSAIWFRKFHEVTFIIIAGLIYGVRWLIFSIIIDPMHIIYIQFLHGLTFGLFYMSAFQYVTRLVPRELLGTGHLLFISIFFGLSGILGSLIGGGIMEEYGGAALYRIMGYLSFIGSIGLSLYLYNDNKRSNTLKLQKNMRTVRQNA
jgi:PPP family 3-phenylpropionic acid transporter